MTNLSLILNEYIPTFYLHMIISFGCFSIILYLFTIFKNNIALSFISTFFMALSVAFFILEENILYYAIFESFLAASFCFLTSSVLRFSYKDEKTNFKWLSLGHASFSILFLITILFFDHTIITSANNEKINTNSVLTAGFLTYLLSSISFFFKIENEKEEEKVAK